MAVGLAMLGVVGPAGCGQAAGTATSSTSVATAQPALATPAPVLVPCLVEVDAIGSGYKAIYSADIGKADGQVDPDNPATCPLFQGVYTDQAGGYSNITAHLVPVVPPDVRLVCHDAHHDVSIYLGDDVQSLAEESRVCSA